MFDKIVLAKLASFAIILCQRLLSVVKTLTFYTKQPTYVI
jgi:hypothetical protein